MTEEKWVDLESLKVLLFIDQKEQLKHYLSMLRFCGLRDIRVAESLSEAIKNIIVESFDLIIVTHFGEATATTKLLEELKSLDATSGVPLVAITSDSGVANALRILAKGVDEILTEPLSQQAVEMVANRVLEKHFGNDPIRERVDEANELIEKGELDQADEILQELLAQSDRHFDIHLHLFRINSLRKEWREAEKHIRKSLEIAKGSSDEILSHRQLADIFYNYGYYYYERQYKLEKALKSYRTSVSLNPFKIQSIKALLSLYQRRDEVDNIVTLLKEAQANFLPYSQSTEEIAVIAEKLAQKMSELNMAEQAKKVYEQVILFQHENVSVHLRTADYFLELGQISAVLRSLVRASQKINDPDLLGKIGSILLDSERRFLSGNGPKERVQAVDLSFFQGYDRDKVIAIAQKTLRQALLLDPDNPQLLICTARCQLRKKEQEAANETLDKLRSSIGDDIDGLVSAIEALIEEEAYDLAVHWLKDGVEAFPKEVDLYKLYADCFKSQEKSYDAIGCLKRGLSIQPDHPELNLELGHLYRELGHYSDAIAAYENAGKAQPNDPDIQEALRKTLELKYLKEKRGK